MSRFEQKALVLRIRLTAKILESHARIMTSGAAIGRYKLFQNGHIRQVHGLHLALQKIA